MKKLTTQILCSFLLLLMLVSCGNESANNGGEATTNTTVTTPSEGGETGTTAPAEQPKSEKEEILKSLVGDHKLEGISGMMGMNTMFDYAQDGGQWIGTGSENMGGEREAYDMTPGDYALTLLETMQITVNEDLSIEVKANESTYISIPFKAEGMQYDLSKPLSEYMSLSAEFDANTTMKDNFLYIAASDKEDISNIGAMDIAEIFPNSYLLRYSTATKTLELDLFSSEGTDMATYTFK